MALITLTTDFGEGSYVAQVKGVILSLLPTVRFVDVTHLVAPGDTLEAAYLLETVLPAFPEGSFHLAVVDPGVGMERKAIAVKFGGKTLVGPDNGVFSAFLPGAEEIREIADRELFLEDVSPTFHGRDVFAPVVAHLAGGGRLDSVGPVLDGDAVVHADLRTTTNDGRVLHVDRFGNLITSFPGSRLQAARGLGGPDAEVTERHRTFGEAEPGRPFLYVGSGGRVEVAVNGASAADALGWGRGTAVRILE